MRARIAATAFALLLGTQVVPPNAARGGEEELVLADATRTLEAMVDDARSGVPPGILGQSEGVIVVPNLIGASFVVGAKYGRGVFLVRDARGKWGNPVFVTLSGGSVGLQAGARAAEILMVIRSKETITRLLAGKGKVTLGVDAGVAAGPTGSGVGADTDIEMRAEILTYARNRGLFAGAALGGASIRIDRHADGIYYDDFALSTFQIIEGQGAVVPPEAARLKATLAAIADPAPAKSRMGTDVDVAVVPDELDAPADPRVARASRTRRAVSVTPGSAEDGDDETTPRAAAPRRRKVTPAVDPLDDPDADAPRSARATAPGTMSPARRSSATNPDDTPAAPPRTTTRPSTRRVRPAPPPADDPVDETPVRKAPATPRVTPKDGGELPG